MAIQRFFSFRRQDASTRSSTSVAAMVPISIVVASFIVGLLAGLLAGRGRSSRRVTPKRRTARDSSSERFSLDASYGAATEGGVIRPDARWTRPR
jgi:hypothetical protein